MQDAADLLAIIYISRHIISHPIQTLREWKAMLLEFCWNCAGPPGMCDLSIGDINGGD